MFVAHRGLKEFDVCVCVCVRLEILYTGVHSRLLSELPCVDNKHCWREELACFLGGVEWQAWLLL